MLGVVLIGNWRGGQLTGQWPNHHNKDFVSLTQSDTDVVASLVLGQRGVLSIELWILGGVGQAGVFASMATQPPLPVPIGFAEYCQQRQQQQ